LPAPIKPVRIMPVIEEDGVCPLIRFLII